MSGSFGRYDDRAGVQYDRAGVAKHPSAESACGHTEHGGII
ncbi:MAG TPA: hypothetical protein PLH64_02910 [Anaerolineaceae bacterium]|nr:hypothetical protein [Anaerolineaceae bacterium]